VKRKNREKRREIGLKLGDWEFGIIGMYQKQKDRWSEEQKYLY
jgi:hypothetical protein